MKKNRRVAARALLNHLNKKYALVHHGGRVKILVEEKSEEFVNQKVIDYLSRADFSTLLENRQSYVKGWKKPVKHAFFFLNTTGRRKFSGVAFSPNKVLKKQYNLWNGFNVDPSLVAKSTVKQCSKMLYHIKHVIADDNKRLNDYVLNWCAHLIQRPEEKVGVALVLKSEKQGTGKTTFVELLGSLLGQHYNSITNSDHLLGKFNHHLEDKLLLGMEEAFWAGDKKARNMLKSLITDSKIMIEPKGFNAYPAKSYSRLIFCSNEEWVVPVEVNDRRFQAMDISPAFANNREYFKALRDEWETGGKEAFFKLLQNRSIEGFNFIQDRVMTDCMIEQKQQTLPIILKWLINALTENDFAPNREAVKSEPDMYAHPGYNYKFCLDEEEDRALLSDYVFENYLRYCRDKNLKSYRSKQHLSKTLNKILKFKRVRDCDGVIRWVFKSLKECRKSLEDYVGLKIDWCDNYQQDKTPYDPTDELHRENLEIDVDRIWSISQMIDVDKYSLDPATTTQAELDKLYQEYIDEVERQDSEDYYQWRDYKSERLEMLIDQCA